MTIRQLVLKALYPFLMKAGKRLGAKTRIERNVDDVIPVEPLYELHVKLNNGSKLNFNDLRGKKIMMVNIASDCGYTQQLSELQKLHEQHNGRLVIIGFPSNDFKEQEKGTDEEIALFCKLNYGVEFLLSEKTVVIKAGQQNPVFQWLTYMQKNGWNDKSPEWNFSKYLVNEEGILTHYFGPTISPLNSEVINNL
jgi:glutathione peroxidase